MKTIIIDTNTLVLYLLCSTNINYLKSHDRLNAFDRNDFIYIDGILKTFDRVITTPNVWTEVDDLCTNTIKGDDKYIYICIIKKLVTDFIEIYTPTQELSENHNAFYNLGFADTGLLELSIIHKNLMTTDSMLSDFARASNVTVIDLMEYKTQKILLTP